MSGSRESIAIAILERLSHVLEPVATGLAIAIAAKLILGEPEVPPAHSGWGVGRSAKILLTSLSNYPIVRPHMSRGWLDSIPTLVHLAVGFAIFIWLLNPDARTTLFACYALLLARLTHLGYRRLDAWHDELELQMEPPAPTRARAGGIV